MKPEETWVGIGIKSGGSLLIGGVETTTGKFFNVGNPGVTYNFNIVSRRWGLGLGGGGGLVVIFVFKLKSLYWLNHRSVDDWGVNISIGGKQFEILKFLANKNFFHTVRYVGRSLNLLTNYIEDFRNVSSFLYNVNDFDSKADHPILSLDVPGVGLGLELSAFKSYGKIYLED